MTPPTAVHDDAPRGERPTPELRRAYVRVIAMWLLSLAGLWLLQSCYGG